MKDISKKDIEFRQQNMGDNIWTLRIDTKSEKKIDAIKLKKQILENQEIARRVKIWEKI